MRSLSQIPSYDGALDKLFTGVYNSATTKGNELVPFVLVRAVSPHPEGTENSSLADDLLRSVKAMSTSLQTYSFHCLPDVLVVQSNSYRSVPAILQLQDECLQFSSSFLI